MQAPPHGQDSACNRRATWGHSPLPQPTNLARKGTDHFLYLPGILGGNAPTRAYLLGGSRLPGLAATLRAPALRVGWIRRPRFAAGTESGTVRVEPRFPPAASFNRAPPRLCLTPHGRAAGEERGHTTSLLRCAPPSFRDRGAGRVSFYGVGSRGTFLGRARGAERVPVSGVID